MIRNTAKDGNDFIDTGALRSVAGLGGNVTEVYTNGRCYLKGFFNAVEACRFGHSIDGWKLSDTMLVTATMDRSGLPPVEFKKG